MESNFWILVISLCLFQAVYVHVSICKSAKKISLNKEIESVDLEKLAQIKPACLFSASNLLFLLVNNSWPPLLALLAAIPNFDFVYYVGVAWFFLYIGKNMLHYGTNFWGSLLIFNKLQLIKSLLSHGLLEFLGIYILWATLLLRIETHRIYFVLCGIFILFIAALIELTVSRRVTINELRKALLNKGYQVSW